MVAWAALYNLWRYIYNLSYSCTVKFTFYFPRNMPWFSVPCTYTIVFAKHVCVFRTVISKLLTMNYHLKINFIFLYLWFCFWSKGKPFKSVNFFSPWTSQLHFLLLLENVCRFWSEGPASPVGCVQVVFGWMWAPFHPPKTCVAIVMKHSKESRSPAIYFADLYLGLTAKWKWNVAFTLT